MNLLQIKSILYAFELTSCLVGFFYWGKIKNTFWKYFPIYLLAIFVTELSGLYFLLFAKKLFANIDVYRYWGLPIQFFFFFWLYYQYFKKSMLYYLPFLCTVLYVVSWIVEEIWLREDKLWFGQLSYSVGCIMLLVLLLIFSTRLIKSQELIDYKKNMMLWTSLGILLFYIGTAPFWVVRSTLLEKDLDLFYTFNNIQGILCCSMYSLFTIAFICGQPK